MPTALCTVLTVSREPSMRLAFSFVPDRVVAAGRLCREPFVHWSESEQQSRTDWPVEYVKAPYATVPHVVHIAQQTAWCEGVGFLLAPTLHESRREDL
jgi:hypothetical protein